MSDEILKKLIKIASNQQKILETLAQMQVGDASNPPASIDPVSTPASTSNNSERANRIFMAETEKLKQLPEWQRASPEKKKQFLGDLREAITALIEDNEMGG